MKIRRASSEEIGRLTGKFPGLPLLGWVGEADGATTGAGGLVWAAGRCWLWLDIASGERPPAVLLWRMARKTIGYAACLGEANLWAVRDPRFDTSERLLTRLGFEHTDETFEDQEVWRCRVSN